MGVSKISKLRCLPSVAPLATSRETYLVDKRSMASSTIKPYYDLTSSVQWKLLRLGELFGVSPFMTSENGISFKWASKQTAYFLFVLALSTCWLGYFAQMLINELIK